MELNILNQNGFNNLNTSAFLKSTLGSKFENNSNYNVLFSKKGEAIYQRLMDNQEEGKITFDELREYGKNNDISAGEMKKMLELKIADKMSQDVKEQSSNTEKEDELKTGNLEIIYAEENDPNYDENIDSNKDSKISYKEYLRYCEQNAKPEAKNSDTRITKNDKSKFMTISYGKVSNTYNSIETEAPEGKIESIA